MSRIWKPLAVGIAAVSAGAALGTTAAHAQATTGVQMPIAIKVGVALPTDKNFGSSSLDLGASYDFSKTLATNPTIYEVYADYYGKSSDNVLGIGVAARFLQAPATVANKAYFGAGIGAYINKVSGGSNKTNLGGKVFGGYTFTQQVFGEVDYTLSNKNNGINPSAIGLRVGYRF